MSLIKLIPTGATLKSNGNNFRFCEFFDVVLGGYATIEVAKFITRGKPFYISLDICDSQFGLPKLLEEMSAKPFSELDGYMKEFVCNAFKDAAVIAKSQGGES